MTYSIELPDNLYLETGVSEALYTAYTAMSPGDYGITLENLKDAEGLDMEASSWAKETIEQWILSRHDFWEMNGLDPDKAYDEFKDQQS